ncbi:hypothetical protein BH11MYX3_BH11MYX3_33690 [soil metagenome]
MLAKWGSGGMADVYVARQGGAGGFDKLVALKFLRDHGDDVGARDMFKQELMTAALLNHPSIVQTFDAGEIDGRMYMAMEFVHGETLSRFHREVTRLTETFPTELALFLAREVASALDYAHTLTTIDGEALGLVHRDISPSNVLVSFDGGVKLLDFGIARVTTKLRSTQNGVIMGKFAYMSPEQAAGEAVDHRSDIYALGILLWQLLVGRQAFDADSDAALMYQVLHPNLAPPSKARAGCGSPELDAIVMKALAPDRRDRYASAGDLASALTAHLAVIAPGYEGGKVIREHMSTSFAERKEPLARAIKGVPESTLSLEELELLSGSAINTPSPHVMFSPTAEPDVEISVSATDAPRSRPRAPTRRSGWVTVAALVTLIAPAVIAWRILADRSSSPAPDAATIAAPAVAVAVAVAEPAPTPRTVEPEPAKSDAVDPSPAPATPTPVGEQRTAKRTPTPSPPKRAVRVAARERSIESPAPAPVPVPVPPPVAPPPPIVPAPVAPPPVAPAPVAPAPVAPAPVAPVIVPSGPCSLDAVPSGVSITVDGPLPDSEVRSGVERALGTFRDCYRAAAKQAGKTPALKLKIAFSIDESRSAQDLRVSGDTLGVGSCVKDAAAKLRPRVAPDVGTATVSVVIKFKPVGG